MTDELNNLNPRRSDSGPAWNEIWSQALTHPSVATFDNLISQPHGTSQRAYKWVFLSALVGSTVATVAGWLRGQSPNWIQLVSIPILALLALVALMFTAGVTQLVARAIGGVGNYTQLVFAFATFNAPMAIVTGFIFGTILLLPLSVYWLTLNVIAIKAVHHFGWGKAVASALPVTLGVLLIPLAAIIILVVNLRS